MKLPLNPINPPPERAPANLFVLALSVLISGVLVGLVGNGVGSPLSGPVSMLSILHQSTSS